MLSAFSLPKMYVILSCGQLLEMYVILSGAAGPAHFDKLKIIYSCCLCRKYKLK